MRPTPRILKACLFLVLASAWTGAAWSEKVGGLRAGAAKVDITPADPTGLTNLWGHGLTGVHDKIYARAIVLDNGNTLAAIVAVDTVEITDGAPIVAEISQKTGIPAANIIVAATHDHNAPIVGLENADGTQKAGPAGVAFVAKVESDVVTAVKLAKANMQAARVGVARGLADINVNRDQFTPDGYIMGWNPGGSSDKTVWVLKVESIAGQPIALLMNYAVHAAIIGVDNSLLTGELPGATSRYVEQHYDDKVIALWTSGAAGDQNPIIMGAGPFGPSQKPTNLDNFEAVDVFGRILGEEVVRIADNTKAETSQPRIWGADKVVTCPGEKVVNRRMPMKDVKTIDTGPVNFHLGVLMIDKVAIAWISAEVVTKIYQELRKQSPFADTLMITLANGRVGYLPDDASYDVWTREAIASPLKKGCGEATIVNGLTGLINQY